MEKGTLSKIFHNGPSSLKQNTLCKVPTEQSQLQLKVVSGTQFSQKFQLLQKNILMAAKYSRDFTA